MSSWLLVIGVGIVVAVCVFASLQVRSMWATCAWLTAAFIAVDVRVHTTLTFGMVMFGAGATFAEVAASYRRRHGLTRKAER